MRWARAARWVARRFAYVRALEQRNERVERWADNFGRTIVEGPRRGTVNGLAGAIERSLDEHLPAWMTWEVVAPPTHGPHCRVEVTFCRAPNGSSRP